MVKPGATFLLPLPTFSPLWKWDSVSTDASAGWKVLCDQQVPGLYRCDENAAQFTTTTASANLTFWGSDIIVYGNSTNGMNYTMALDGNQIQSLNPNVNGMSQVLASWHDLTIDRGHVLTIKTDPGSFSAAAFTLERADVTVNTGYSGNISSTYVDDTSSRIDYAQGSYWYPYADYNGISLPPSVTNETFHASRNVSNSFSLTFNASAILLIGPCYASCGEYYVSIDSEPPVAYNGSWQAPTQVGEGCIRFYKTGLDPSSEHAMTVTNNDDTRWTTLDWVQLVQVGGANKTSIGTTPSGPGDSGPGNGTNTGDGNGNGNGGGGPSSGSGPTGGHRTSTKSLNAGAIVGGVLGGVLLLCVLLGLLVWRCRLKREKSKTKPISFNMENGLDSLDSGSPPSEKINHTIVDGADEVMSTPSYFRRGGRYGPGNHLQPPTITLDTDFTRTTTTSGDMYANIRGTPTTSSSFPSYPITPITPSTNSAPRSPLSPLSQETDSRGLYSIVTPSSLVFSSNSVDYRPPEKRNALPRRNTRRTSRRTSSSRGYMPSISTRTNTTGGRADHGHSPAMERPLPLPPNNQASPTSPTRGMAATLSQVSRDVNRLLMQLGRLRITPGEEVAEDHSVMDEIVPPSEGLEPPEYNDDDERNSPIANRNRPQFP